MTPLMTPAPIAPASKRLGPQGHKFLLSLVSISIAQAVCQEPYSYFLSLTSPVIIFYRFFSHSSLASRASFALFWSGVRGA